MGANNVLLQQAVGNKVPKDKISFNWFSAMLSITCRHNTGSLVPFYECYSVDVNFKTLKNFQKDWRTAQDHFKQITRMSDFSEAKYKGMRDDSKILHSTVN